MPGVTKYSLVDDAHDLRLPVHNDEVFKHGVCFEAKVNTASNRLHECLRSEERRMALCFFDFVLFDKKEKTKSSCPGAC